MRTHDTSTTTCTHPGLPSRWNDKTIVRFDGVISGIRDGKLYQDVEFDLVVDDAGNTKRFRGAWILVDGGYLKWSCTVPPFKTTMYYTQVRWSKWAESMRKDVECTFGILKGRWRILKTGIRVEQLDVADDIWCTCCALHNMLLNVDCLDQKWNKGVRSDYEGALGLHENNDVQRFVPAVFARMAAGTDPRAYDVSRDEGFAPLDGIHVPAGSNAASDRTTTRVNTMSLDGFRNYLVNHFHYKWLAKQVVWPSRTGLREAPLVDRRR